MSKSPIRRMRAHQFGAVGIAFRMRLVARADAADRIAAQRHEALDAERREFGDDLVDLLARGVDAGHVRRRRQPCLVDHPLDGAAGALARRAAGAVGHRDEVRG